jgi:hypothetical protein
MPNATVKVPKIRWMSAVMFLTTAGRQAADLSDGDIKFLRKYLTNQVGFSPSTAGKLLTTLGWVQEEDLKPNDCFTLSQRDWERAVLDDATHFNIFRNLGRSNAETKTVRTFPEAVACSEGPSFLIYAVTAQGRAFCIPPKEYEFYGKRWIDRYSTVG